MEKEESQSPFSSGEVFHEMIMDELCIGFYDSESQSPFSSGEVFHA